MGETEKVQLQLEKGDFEGLRALLSRYGYEYFGPEFTNRLLDELKAQKREHVDA